MKDKTVKQDTKVSKEITNLPFYHTNTCHGINTRKLNGVRVIKGKVLHRPR